MPRPAQCGRRRGAYLYMCGISKPRPGERPAAFTLGKLAWHSSTLASTPRAVLARGSPAVCRPSLTIGARTPAAKSRLAVAQTRRTHAHRACVLLSSRACRAVNRKLPRFRSLYGRTTKGPYRCPTPISRPRIPPPPSKPIAQAAFRPNLSAAPHLCAARAQTRASASRANRSPVTRCVLVVNWLCPAANR